MSAQQITNHKRCCCRAGKGEGPFPALFHVFCLFCLAALAPVMVVGGRCRVEAHVGTPYSVVHHLDGHRPERVHRLQPSFSSAEAPSWEPVLVFTRTRRQRLRHALLRPLTVAEPWLKIRAALACASALQQAGINIILYLAVGKW